MKMNKKMINLDEIVKELYPHPEKGVYKVYTHQLKNIYEALVEQIVQLEIKYKNFDGLGTDKKLFQDIIEHEKLITGSELCSRYELLKPINAIIKRKSGVLIVEPENP